MDELYSLAVSCGGDPSRLVTDYYRQKFYADIHWKMPVGDVDRTFIDYADSRGAELLSECTVLSHLLPDDMLREFRLGFAATLTAHAGLEAGSRAKMKSNHARLFTDGKA
ncbi:hypothetical protein [Streptomyces sp. NBC_00328]|uniref:hypothetical protein n=1 Tax=Streptomyces sp. NBC_00328 TaxID=2903646 RepID=UPI002E2AC856|nr:hypothetical protein [Streptomyces sp. NBC_00328]